MVVGAGEQISGMQRNEEMSKTIGYIRGQRRD